MGSTIIQAIQKLRLATLIVKHIRCDNAGENKVIEEHLIQSEIKEVSM